MTVESVTLSNIMDDIGVTRDLVNLRRHVYLLDQKLSSAVTFSKCDESVKCLFVGSQIEGSTTVGLNSDVDLLLYTNVFEYEDKECSTSLYNPVRDSRVSLPQCCSLQIVREYNFPNIGIKRNNQFRGLIKNTFIYDLSTRIIHYEMTTQRGPAFNLLDYFDFVMAFHCRVLQDECKVLFTRPKPGHWPKPETLARAKSHGIFLMLPGNVGCTAKYNSSNQMAFMYIKYAYDYLSFQYRMSTIKTERLLMSNLNIIQMKTYILMKLIRKELLDPLVDDRLSTFHMKTSLLFTIEEFPEDLWRDEHLVQCVIICMTTLRRFLKRRFCPHYMVADVNLFENKIKNHEFPVLIKVLTKMIDSELTCLYKLKIDNIGIRLAMNPDNLKLQSKLDYRSYIIKTLTITLFQKLSRHIFSDMRVYDTNEGFKRLNQACAKYIQGKFKNEIEYLSHMVINSIASSKASSQILKGMPMSEEIIDEYKQSFRSGNISNYLKYASMLVCTKQFDRAENVLAIAENMVTPDVVHASSDELVKLSEIQGQEGKLSPSEHIKEYVLKIAFDVIFSSSEVNCVPPHLQYEMYKTITDLDKQAIDQRKRENSIGPALYIYSDCVVADAEPFLYYLQYLSSSSGEKALKAVSKFVKYLKRYSKVSGCRNETTLNMFSHICELEKMPGEAFIGYCHSINICPRNNAAYWHLFRFLGKLNCWYRTNRYLMYYCESQ